jgi:hypothetical protein
VLDGKSTGTQTSDRLAERRIKLISDNVLPRAEVAVLLGERLGTAVWVDPAVAGTRLSVALPDIALGGIRNPASR